MINTAYNYKKILSCNDLEQELSDIRSNASRNPCIVLHQAAMILKEALQSSTGIETTPLKILMASLLKRLKMKCQLL